MAGASRSAKTNRPSDNDDQKKLARLRDQRLAAQAVREAAGTWGEISVGEITHVPTGAVFVHCWKGRQEPDLTKIHETRGQDRSPDEHQRMGLIAIDHEVFGVKSLGAVGQHQGLGKIPHHQGVPCADPHCVRRLLAGLALRRGFID